MTHGASATNSEPLDTVVTIVSPENIAFRFRLAGPAARTLAFLIDVLVIGFVAVLAVLAYPGVSKLRIGLMLVALGVLIEVLQHFSGYRFGDWQDAVADGVGVVLGLGLARGVVWGLLRFGLRGVM